MKTPFLNLRDPPPRRLRYALHPISVCQSVPCLSLTRERSRERNLLTKRLLTGMSYVMTQGPVSSSKGTRSRSHDQ